MTAEECAQWRELCNERIHVGKKKKKKLNNVSFKIHIKTFFVRVISCNFNATRTVEWHPILRT
jgi:Leu/Phe-tRNA-protein transferase